MCSVMMLGLKKFQLPFLTGTKVVNVCGKGFWQQAYKYSSVGGLIIIVAIDNTEKQMQFMIVTVKHASV